MDRTKTDKKRKEKEKKKGITGTSNRMECSYIFEYEEKPCRRCCPTLNKKKRREWWNYCNKWTVNVSFVLKWHESHYVARKPNNHQTLGYTIVVFEYAALAHVYASAQHTQKHYLTSSFAPFIQAYDYVCVNGMDRGLQSNLNCISKFRNRM